jgi:hypothetical protein
MAWGWPGRLLGCDNEEFGGFMKGCSMLMSSGILTQLSVPWSRDDASSSQARTLCLRGWCQAETTAWVKQERVWIIEVWWRGSGVMFEIRLKPWYYAKGTKLGQVLAANLTLYRFTRVTLLDLTRNEAQRVCTTYKTERNDLIFVIAKM